MRADASSEIGTGHLMRCLALAQAWKEAGDQVIFITACQSDGLVQRLREEGFDIYLLPHQYPDDGDWDYTKGVLTDHPGAWVALDGYHFDEVYNQRVKESGHSLLVIDDMAHLKHYYADIVLNQNMHAEQLHYACEPYTRLLLGTRYVLLRREFLAWKGWQREISELARHVLVTLGGGDPENHTLKVIQALQRVDVPALEATVVVGASNPYADVLQAAAEQSRIPIRLIRNAENMPELMAWADIAVSAAGSTVWELMFMGVPTLLIAIADNQEPIARSAADSGATIWLDHRSAGWTEMLVQKVQWLLSDTGSRSEFSHRASSLVDGLGTIRIVQALEASKPAEATR